MGGGDLNLKKSWHPGTFRNQERVWKEERKAADEEKKLQQLRKELEEERQIQEFQRLQEQAGGKKRSDRLDWMYQAAPTAAAKDEKALEDFLLGKRRVDEILNKKDGGMKVLSKDSDAFMSQTSKANSARDIQAKVREDPLLAIKRIQQQSMELLMKNPMKMRQLKEDKEPKKKKSKKSKDDKTDKEEKKRSRSDRHSKHRSSHEAEDSSGSEDNRSEKSKHSRKHRRYSRSPEARSPEKTQRHQERSSGSKDHTDSIYRSERHRSTRRSYSPEHHRTSRDIRRSRSRSKSPYVGRPRSRSPAHRYSSSRHHHNRSRSRSPRRSRRTWSRSRSRSPHRSSIRYTSTVKDQRSISNSSSAPDKLGQSNNKNALNEDEEKRKALLAAEREKMLKAMADDAVADAEARKRRLNEISEIEAKQDAEDEANRLASSKNGKASFLKNAQKSAFDSLSLADRVQRGVATMQK